MKISNVSIYRAAEVLVEKHGNSEALFHAALWADRCLEVGDVKGGSVWARIIKAIRDLQADERPDGETLH